MTPLAPSPLTAPVTIGQLLVQQERRLAGVSDTARLDAELMLAEVLGVSRAHLRAWPERAVDAAHRADYERLIERRSRGTPVAYLLGRKPFWSLEIEVSEAVLIPRPETEHLVERALALLPAEDAWMVDLGTGSGAIALAVARERPDAQVIGVDDSSAALEVAAHNAARLGIENVDWRRGAWCAPLAGQRFPLIVTNPPYVPTDDPHLSGGDVRHEPRAALDGGPDGLTAIRRIVAEASWHLAPGGRLVIEHGFDQGAAVAAILSRHGYAHIQMLRDLAGHPRITQACRPASREAPGPWPSSSE